MRDKEWYRITFFHGSCPDVSGTGMLQIERLYSSWSRAECAAKRISKTIGARSWTIHRLTNQDYTKLSIGITW